MRKKAQMEILGLAIVMVLIILALLFVVKFVALKKPSDLKKNVVQSQEASNYISTYLKINVPDCRDLSMTDLLQDCSVRGGIVCDDGLNSCGKAELVASTIFNQTFDARKRHYQFLVYIEENDPFIELGRICPGERRSKTFPLPTGLQTMFVRLDLC